MGPRVAVWCTRLLLLLLLLLSQRMCLCVSTTVAGSVCPRPPWCWDSALNCTVRPGSCDSRFPPWPAPASPRDLLVSSSFHEGRILLNISWAVSPDASALALQGWRLELVFTNLRRECTLLRLHQPVPTPRDPRGHKWRVRACACMPPGEAVLVNVYSEPGGSEPATVFHTAPGCHDEEVAMGATWSCHGDTELQVGALPVGEQGLNVSFSRPRRQGSAAPRAERWVVRACRRTEEGPCSWEVEQLSVEGPRGPEEAGAAMLTRVPRLPCVCVQVFALARAQERVQVCPFMDTALQLRVSLSVVEGGALSASVTVSPGGCAVTVLVALYARGTRDGDAATALADTRERAIESFPVTYNLTQAMEEALHHGVVCVKVWSSSEYRVLGHTDCISASPGSLQFLLLLILVLPLAGAMLLVTRLIQRHRETARALRRDTRLWMTESPLLPPSASPPTSPSRCSRPPLLIAHARDPAVLQQAVQQLASVLQSRCGHGVRVALDLWESKCVARLGPALWVTSTLSSSSTEASEETRATVLVICSRATRDWRPGDGPAGDVLDATLQLLLRAPGNCGGPRVLVACLRGAGDPLDVPPALRSRPCFCIPRDLDALCSELLRGSRGSRGSRGTRRDADDLEAAPSEVAGATRRGDPKRAEEEEVPGDTGAPATLSSGVTRAENEEVTTAVM